MKQNIKVAKELVKLAKSLVAKKSFLQEVFDVYELKTVGQFYKYGNGQVALVTVLDDDWLPVLANGKYESRPDIEKQVKMWINQVKFIDLGDCDSEPATSTGGTIVTIIVKENSPLLKDTYSGEGAITSKIFGLESDKCYQ